MPILIHEFGRSTNWLYNYIFLMYDLAVAPYFLCNFWYVVMELSLFDIIFQVLNPLNRIRCDCGDSAWDCYWNYCEECD